jgi:hypothetical protein
LRDGGSGHARRVGRPTCAKAKADAEAGKLEQEGEQKAKQEFDKEAPQYEQKAKTDAEDYAKKEERDLKSRF